MEFGQYSSRSYAEAVRPNNQEIDKPSRKEKEERQMNYYTEQDASNVRSPIPKLPASDLIRSQSIHSWMIKLS